MIIATHIPIGKGRIIIERTTSKHEI
jgi:hypothetical protein